MALDLLFDLLLDPLFKFVGLLLGLLVKLSEPLRGVARGQAVVLYDGDRVVGSATIERAAKVAVVR